MLDMASEKVYEPRAAKGRGGSDMDVDAPAAEKAERQQAAPSEPTDRDHGEDRVYSDAEWVEYEAQLQDELNWLGARDKQGKSKGNTDRRKGKGKGNDSKGGGGGQWHFVDMVW